MSKHPRPNRVRISDDEAARLDLEIKEAERVAAAARMRPRRGDGHMLLGEMAEFGNPEDLVLGKKRSDFHITEEDLKRAERKGARKES